MSTSVKGSSAVYSDTFSPDGHVRYKIDLSREGEFDEAYSGTGG
jgi:hypothetical protein